MPRKKWVNKCSYCRGSKLTNTEFEFVLMGFVSGIPISHVRDVMRCRFPEKKIPDEKTIRRHYSRIGDALYKRFFKRDILRDEPELRQLERSDPEEFEEFMRHLAEHWHATILDTSKSVDRGDDSGWFAHDMASIYRDLCRMKYGTRANASHYLTLAFLWACVRSETGENKVGGLKISAKTLALVVHRLLHEFRERPC